MSKRLTLNILTLFTLWNTESFSALEELSDNMNPGKKTIVPSSVAEYKEWVAHYMNNPQANELWLPDDKNPKSKEWGYLLVARTLYWSATLGLDRFLDKMSYEELTQFHPMERSWEKTPLGEKLQEVMGKMTEAITNQSGSYALQQVSWLIFIRNHGVDEFTRLEHQRNA